MLIFFRYRPRKRRKVSRIPLVIRPASRYIILTVQAGPGGPERPTGRAVARGRRPIVPRGRGPRKRIRANFLSYPGRETKGSFRHSVFTPSREPARVSGTHQRRGATEPTDERRPTRPSRPTHRVVHSRRTRRRPCTTPVVHADRRPSYTPTVVRVPLGSGRSGDERPRSAVRRTRVPDRRRASPGSGAAEARPVGSGAGRAVAGEVPAACCGGV